ncbi:MAG TPA: hypothetical protein VGQ57_03650 [Polyangiaceae bacterium]|jgi:hypothetical protein|nr:hypothetical protein [Polyangiaceae bacterium]
MSAPTLFDLAGGGTALLLSLDGEFVTVLAPQASPPGSSLAIGFEGQTLTIKVRGSRRVEPDDAGRTFRVEGRFVSLSRAQRLALTAKGPA